jgi:hypothetical protein
MTLTLTYIFIFAAIHWLKIIYVILQVIIRYGEWSSVATAGTITTLSRTVKGHIREASSIQERKLFHWTQQQMSQLNLYWIDANKGLRHMYIITIQVIASLETNWISEFKFEKNIKIMSYITNVVIIKFVAAVATEILISYVNVCIPHSK